ncbi:hypothetical protein GLAREA_06167 [Glarea lozoyensis ATCC 20868]|uniref:Uncharacterized protein n=1 Tax=Glarea lozoyensis (strain ATCC 20868 / MF5171) TaxID=1116229 RepID=S3D5X3_GLAL2|nr:uncharacterized protein GLAREA_06167 [Glarea lozoyensis ATCC 20868]EPE33155.1 hypothetical protein GLAREA_06167 [Glarea lozoyensis ATCC 20868]
MCRARRSFQLISICRMHGILMRGAEIIVEKGQFVGTRFALTCILELLSKDQWNSGLKTSTVRWIEKFDEMETQRENGGGGSADEQMEKLKIFLNDVTETLAVKLKPYDDEVAGEVTQ